MTTEIHLNPYLEAIRVLQTERDELYRQLDEALEVLRQLVPLEVVSDGKVHMDRFPGITADALVNAANVLIKYDAGENLHNDTPTGDVMP